MWDTFQRPPRATNNQITCPTQNTILSFLVFDTISHCLTHQIFWVNRCDTRHYLSEVFNQTGLTRFHGPQNSNKLRRPRRRKKKLGWVKNEESVSSGWVVLRIETDHNFSLYTQFFFVTAKKLQCICVSTSWPSVRTRHSFAKIVIFPKFPLKIFICLYSFTNFVSEISLVMSGHAMCV